LAVLFARIKVADLDNFRAVHKKAGELHARYRLTETVWHDVSDPRSLMIAIRGSHEDIAAWRASSERARLSGQLKLESADGSWLTEEMFAEGEYGK
jgi:hypothetical protein